MGKCFIYRLLILRMNKECLIQRQNFAFSFPQTHKILGEQILFHVFNHRITILAIHYALLIVNCQVFLFGWLDLPSKEDALLTVNYLKTSFPDGGQMAFSKGTFLFSPSFCFLFQIFGGNQAFYAYNYGEPKITTFKLAGSRWRGTTSTPACHNSLDV